MISSLIILLILLTGPGSIREQFIKASDKNITAVLGSGKIKEVETFPGKEYYIFESDNSKNGAIVVFSSAPGRYENFDYMLIFNSSNEIIDIKILKYRSEYGYEISNKGWLKQFYRNPPDRFEYRKDISALSGATYSAPSLVEDVNHIIEHLRKSGKMQ